MIEECPFCGSIRIVETLKGGTRICLACESRFDTVNGKSKQTLFDRITASPEVLAPNFVVEVITEYLTAKFVTGRRSTIIPGKTWEHEAEAIAATVARLKEARDGAE